MSEGTKAALIVGGVLGTVAIVAIVLFVVLPMLLGAVLFSQLDDMFEEYNPTAVEVGEAFQWNDSDYAAGWKVSGEAGERLRPTGLTFTSSDYALDSPPETYAISFVRDGVVITQASCDTENRIKSGSANKLECQTTDDVVGKYDAVVIGYPEDLETGDRWKPDSDEAA
jgi:hypothetical protein